MTKGWFTNLKNSPSIFGEGNKFFVTIIGKRDVWFHVGNYINGLRQDSLCDFTFHLSTVNQILFVSVKLFGVCPYQFNVRDKGLTLNF